MGPVQGIRFNSGLPDFANRFELPEELPRTRGTLPGSLFVPLLTYLFF